MRISLHGGDCCGIKHIHGLGYYPDTYLSARKKRKMTSFGQQPYNNGINDMIHKNARGKSDFFNEAAPMETSEARFSRFVDFIKAKRPNGMIEIVLNTHQMAWKPIITAMGFLSGPSGKNSNTAMVITAYHLVY